MNVHQIEFHMSRVILSCSFSTTFLLKQAEKLKSCKMNEGWMKIDDICECDAFVTEKWKIDLYASFRG